MKNFFSLVYVVLSLSPLAAYETLESELRTNGSLMHAIVSQPVQSLQNFSAVLYNGREEMGYGIVVSEDGYIVSKWSELKNVKEMKVRIGEQQYPEVAFVAGDPVWDVCLLKVSATGLKAVDYASSSDVGQGTWVVSNGATTRALRRPMIGVISANSREIGAEGGAVLGVELAIDKDKSGMVVGSVPEVSGAFKAGILKGDKILMLGDKKITSRKDVADAMKERRVGEMLEVKISRGGKEQVILVELMGRADTFGAEKSRNDEMSGDISKRRSGFPRVLQHDTLGSTITIGGPLLDLDGKCLGMNIARANRAESFAIPVEELRQLVEKMLSKAKSQSEP